MSPTFSVFLDLTRFIAAVAVLLYHAEVRLAINIGPAAHFAHDAVLVFFVLSGLVISYAVQYRDGSLSRYAINRAARLASVAIPAVVLSLLLWAVGRVVVPATYPQSPGTALLDSLLSALFLNQVWYLNFGPPANEPFWSLGFEVWYYALFGAALFLRGPRRIVALLVLAAIAGPKILSLLPVWLFGVVIFAMPRRPSLVGGLTLLGVVGAAYVACRLGAWPEALVRAVDDAMPGHGDFGMARYYASDYVVGAVVAAGFVAVRMLDPWIAPVMRRLEPAARLCAGFTFSIYLYQQPLLVFIGAVAPRIGYAGLVLTLAVIVALALVTERKKGVLRRLLVRAFAPSLQVPAAAPALAPVGRAAG